MQIKSCLARLFKKYVELFRSLTGALGGACSLLMLWSQITYGHRTASFLPKNRTILRRPNGARPAAGRIVPFFYHFFRHRTVPGEV